ncbi:hypothetical protein DL764_009652 [Monosporascus ibericus]|uniref:Uncharacterized protein n=1 Tax=Monosporascus ibericus TaxID=155417 RepID=A0A4Q4SX82_9PEZI|nr:hypothetical protein DL764_009652 [Monosporascus ibericus]
MATGNEKWIFIIIAIIITTRTTTNNNSNNNRAARAQAAAAAEAAAAAVDSVPEPEPELEPEGPPAPDPAAEPSTPARPPRQRPAQGARRAVPCKGCLRSALSGRFTGACYDAAVGSRCWRYASGHTYHPVPALIRPLAVRLVAALEAGDRPAVRRLRAAVRALQEGEAENEGEKEGQVGTPAGAPAAVRRQVLGLVRQILDLLLP